ncbi:MAG: tRNA-binding protein [Deltaproteobacteria bacterium]|nr:MAG: tRNA-binding protein [Deltaproteobacteria bacterium]
MATIEDFNVLDIRVGEIVEVKEFPEARNPSYKLKVDFGKEIGIKKSSAQIVENYSIEELLNKHVLGVVNFPPRQIGPFISEVLILGVPDDNSNTILITPDSQVSAGGKLH